MKPFLRFRLLILLLHLALPSFVFASGTEYYEPPRSFQFNHSHEKWNEVLKKVITSESLQTNTQIDMEALKRHIRFLDAYIESVESVALTEFNGFSKTEQLAFLVNSFNALTLAASLRAGTNPPQALKGDAKLTIFSETISVADFTQQFMKKRISDPRAFLAFLCFDPGCPAPYREALAPDKLEGQLEQITSSFLADRSKNLFDKNSNRILLSPVFRKYEAEITKKYGSLSAFVGRYLIKDPILLMKARAGTLKVDYMKF